MTATGHALVGASIAAIIPNPAIALPLSLLSHFIGDKLPHWDPMTNKNKSWNLTIAETVADVLLGYLLVAGIFLYLLHTPNPTMIFLSAFIAQLPDWFEIPYSIFKMKLAPFYQDYLVQKWIHHVWFNSKMQAPWGVLTQITVVVIFLAAVLTLGPLS